MVLGHIQREPSNIRNRSDRGRFKCVLTFNVVLYLSMAGSVCSFSLKPGALRASGSSSHTQPTSRFLSKHFVWTTLFVHETVAIHSCRSVGSRINIDPGPEWRWLIGIDIGQSNTTDHWIYNDHWIYTPRLTALAWVCVDEDLVEVLTRDWSVTTTEMPVRQLNHLTGSSPRWAMSGSRARLRSSPTSMARAWAKFELLLSGQGRCWPRHHYAQGLNGLGGFIGLGCHLISFPRINSNQTVIIHGT